MINGVQRIAATSDGGIAWAGYYYVIDTGANPMILGHLAADGSTDTAFGDAATPGYSRPAVETAASFVYPSALLVQPDGKLVVSATYSGFPNKEDFLAIRTSSTGLLDATFGTGGIVEIDLAPPPDGVYSESSAAALQPDGRIILGGRAQLSSEFLVDLGVVRLLNAAGPTDTIFADGFEP
jgi:uncharacterized delta-60 repeat protein